MSKERLVGGEEMVGQCPYYMKMKSELAGSGGNDRNEML